MADEAENDMLEQEGAQTPLSETPEFQMALAARLADIQSDIEAKFDAKLKALAKGDGTAPDALDMASKIAAAIGEMNDQGAHRKTVAPAVMAARRAAQSKMEKLLLAARDLPTKERPKYQIIATGWFKDRLVHPYSLDPKTRQQVPTTVFFMSSPNMGMRPINKAAKEIWAAFMGSVSNGESEVPFVVKPVWVTDSGVVITGTAPQTARAHGKVIDYDNDLDLGDGQGVPEPVGQGESDEDDDLMIENDPRGEEVAVLGTIAAKAKRSSGLGLGDKRV